jgi:hypothetical protein
MGRSVQNPAFDQNGPGQTLNSVGWAVDRSSCMQGAAFRELWLGRWGVDLAGHNGRLPFGFWRPTCTTVYSWTGLPQ